MRTQSREQLVEKFEFIRAKSFRTYKVVAGTASNPFVWMAKFADVKSSKYLEFFFEPIIRCDRAESVHDKKHIQALIIIRLRCRTDCKVGQVTESVRMYLLQRV